MERGNQGFTKNNIQTMGDVVVPSSVELSNAFVARRLVERFLLQRAYTSSCQCERPSNKIRERND